MKEKGKQLERKEEKETHFKKRKCEEKWKGDRKGEKERGK